MRVPPLLVLAGGAVRRAARQILALFPGGPVFDRRPGLLRLRGTRLSGDDGALPLAPAGDGDTVRIHYTGWLGDGRRFDSSRGAEPLEFRIGSGQVVAGVERAVRGMIPGETKRTVVPHGDAYGPRIEAYRVEVDRSRLPAGEVLVGDLMEITGSPIPARVVEFRGERVLLDVNHPLAGEDLEFEISLIEITSRGAVEPEAPPPAA
jgi:peptidylprolyl isomerase